MDQLEVTTITSTGAVLHGPGRSPVEVDGLDPGHEHTVEGTTFRTLDRPPGQLLTTFATVNDLHYGETECGVIEGMDVGPILSAEPGEPPYADMMNAGALAEMVALDPAVVIAKGDLTSHGTHDEHQQFVDAYSAALGDRVVAVRGNHDAYFGEVFADTAVRQVDLPGVTLAVLDTVLPGHSGGRLTTDQIEWLDAVGSGADRPVLVFGHHHVWDPASRSRPATYFGINPDDSERLVEVFARRPRLRGYFAGHTHRNRVRRFAATGDVPWVEVSCVKDYPGGWAEYQVFEGGITQVFHRTSSPEALDWSDRTRQMFGGMYPAYAFGGIEDRCFTVPAQPA